MSHFTVTDCVTDSEAKPWCILLSTPPILKASMCVEEDILKATIWQPYHFSAMSDQLCTGVKMFAAPSTRPHSPCSYFHLFLFLRITWMAPMHDDTSYHHVLKHCISIFRCTVGVNLSLSCHIL